MNVFGVPLLKASLWANGGLFAALILTWAVQQGRVASAKKNEADVRVEMADLRTELATARADFEEKARQLEADAAARLRDRVAEIQEAFDRATETTNGVVADLRDGNSQLREQWRACIANPGVPETPADAGTPEETVNDIPAAIGRVLGIGAAADKRYAELYAVAEACYRATGTEP